MRDTVENVKNIIARLSTTGWHAGLMGEANGKAQNGISTDAYAKEKFPFREKREKCATFVTKKMLRRKKCTGEQKAAEFELPRKKKQTCLQKSHAEKQTKRPICSLTKKERNPERKKKGKHGSSREHDHNLSVAQVNFECMCVPPT